MKVGLHHAIFLAFLLSATAAAAGRPDADWRGKVDPQVLDAVRLEQTEFLIFLEEKADLGPAAGLSTKEEKGRFVFDALREVADRTQTDIIETLEQSDIPYRSFWLGNYIWVKGNQGLVELLARRSDVRTVGRNPRILMPEVTITEVESARESASRGLVTEPAAVAWDIQIVNAPLVWAQGVTGEGAVVAGMDTGYDWDHPAIVNQYRGWDGMTADHAYNWHDAVHQLFQPGCGPDSPEPCDDSGHGTHTMGTMVGDDGGANQIGMAPGAKWMACRCWEPVNRTDITYLTECLQFMLAPTDANDENPDPTKAPHVVNNSWVCDPGEGCVDPNALKDIFGSLRAAGVMQVGGTGNDGPGCCSVYYPPAIYDSFFSVGATTIDDEIADFSSRGPVTVDGSNRPKPDISAPGQDIRGAATGGGYFTGSGTSFAGPHVAGLVALLISANPALSGQVDALEVIIRQSAVPMTSEQDCVILGSEVPNNIFGWGRIDAWTAYQLAISGTASAPHPTDPEFRLLPNSPNPVGATTLIRYELPRRTPVTLHIYDVAGRLVRELVAGTSQPPGKYAVTWDGQTDSGHAAASGLYFYRLGMGTESVTRRMVVAR